MIGWRIGLGLDRRLGWVLREVSSLAKIVFLVTFNGWLMNANLEILILDLFMCCGSGEFRCENRSYERCDPLC